MDNGHQEESLRGREVFRVLNQRPGWRISLKRVYVMLEQGVIPNVAFHGVHNTHYTISRAKLEEWARGVEKESARRQAVKRVRATVN